ncbi:MAG: hypothetical protein OEW64_09775 [Gammaproteobacteria bacterium]|nr:hypothetical protein [Gammaproteobacteria bacterium]MDH5304372.1 hypothetical protein [Gammaproteobacteria bacterium]MDH5320968.1 hypothetical protein [Gammaproteobacteria bacterium]
MLQVKLIVDGFRDIVLLPTSIVAAIVSLARGRNGVPGPQFYRLLVMGKQSEHWIDLFGALRNAPADVDRAATFDVGNLDDIVSNVEKFVVDEYQRGGVTAQAKSRIDAALKAMRRKNTKGPMP